MAHGQQQTSQSLQIQNNKIQKLHVHNVVDRVGVRG